MARSRGDLWPSALLKWLSRKYKALRTVCQGSFQAVLTTGLGDNTFKTLSFFFNSCSTWIAAVPRNMAVKEAELVTPCVFGELCSLKTFSGGRGHKPLAAA